MVAGPRILGKLFDGAKVTINAEEPYYTLEDANGWEPLSNNVFVSREYYDLHGYNREDLTAFVQGIDIQEGGVPVGLMSTHFIIDLITNSKPTDTDLLSIHSSLNNVCTAVGFYNSVMNMEDILYARTRQYVLDGAWAATGSQRLGGVGSWGQGQASAATKVHLTRVLVVGDVAGESIRIPPANYVTAVIIAQEKDLAYLMRKKRSFEAQGSIP